MAVEGMEFAHTWADTPMKDADIRPRLRHWIEAIYPKSIFCRHFEEMRLGSAYGANALGASSKRKFAVADFLVVNVEGMHAFEIKSDADTLNRLERQVPHYSAVCDTVSIVTTKKYYKKVKDIVPGWWGILIPTKFPPAKYIKEKGTPLDLHRLETKNPGKEAVSVAAMLWRNDLIDLLYQKEVQKPAQARGRGVGKLREVAAENVSLEDLSAFVRLNLLRRNRHWWREDL